MAHGRSGHKVESLLTPYVDYEVNNASVVRDIEPRIEKLTTSGKVSITSICGNDAKGTVMPIGPYGIWMVRARNALASSAITALQFKVIHFSEL
jgi:hypothetical protein